MNGNGIGAEDPDNRLRFVLSYSKNPRTIRAPVGFSPFSSSGGSHPDARPAGWTHAKGIAKGSQLIRRLIRH